MAVVRQEQQGISMPPSLLRPLLDGFVTSNKFARFTRFQEKSVYFRQKGDIFDMDPGSMDFHHRPSPTLSLSKLFIRVKFSSDRATQDVTEDDHRIAPIKRNFDGASSRINRLLRQSRERREWRIGHAYRPSFVPFTRRLLLLLATK